MMLIDKTACLSRLNRVHPLEKMTFVALTMAIALAFDTLTVHLFIIFSVPLVLFLVARVSLVYFLKLMVLPLAFLVPALLAIFVSTGPASDQFLLSVPLFSTYVGIVRSDLLLSLRYLLRSLSLISSLYFLILTTHLPSILSQLRKMKFTGFLLELAGLMYRYIFVLLKEARTIYAAQRSRLGHKGFRSSIKSFGNLFSSLFVKTMKRADDIENALHSRFYTGNLLVLEPRFPVSLRNYLYIGAYCTILVLFGIFTKGMTVV